MEYNLRISLIILLFLVLIPSSLSTNLESIEAITPASTYLNISNNLFVSSSNVGIGTSSPGQKLDVSGGNIRTTGQLISTVATGTAPLSVSSTTKVTNLNADLLDDYTTTSTGNFWGVIPFVGSDGVIEVGKYIDFHEADADTGDYAARLYSTSSILYRNGNKVWDAGTDGSGSGLDADLLDGHDSSYFQAAITNPVTGTGNANYITKWTGTTSVGNSIIYETGGNVGIGTTSPNEKLDVDGAIFADDGVIRNYEHTDYAKLASKLVYRRYSHSAEHPTTTEGLTDLIKGASFVSQGVTANISGFSFGADKYAVEFVGYFYAASSGVYTFGVNSDDASDLFIDGKLVAYWYGGHGINPSPTPGGTQLTAYLEKGYHRLYTRFEEGTGGDSHEIVYKTPGSGTWATIPSSVLFHHPNDLLMGSGDDLAIMSGKVGIGTTSPGAKLDVEGNLMLQYGAAINEFSTDTTLAGNSDLAVPTEKAIKTYVDAHAGSGLTGTGTANYITKWTGTTSVGTSVIYETGGKIGIGTSSPVGKLHVIGGSGGYTDPTILTQPNSATNAWSAIELYGGTFDTTGDYMIGRGSSTFYSGRALTIHVPDLDSGYYGGIGENPKIVFLSSGAEEMGHIESGTNEWYMVGNVGIGTTSPGAKLEVNGAAKIQDTLEVDINSNQATWGHPYIANIAGWGTTAYPTIGSTGGSSGSLIMLHNPHVPWRTDNAASGWTGRSGIRMAYDSSGNWWDMGMIDGEKWAVLDGNAPSTPYLTIINNGNVGIGTTSPGYKLDVSGTAKISDVLTLTGQGASGGYGLGNTVALRLNTPVDDGITTIWFPSKGNYPSDYAYISYDEDYCEAGVTCGENGALILGAENDGTTSSDHVRVKSRLVVEADMYSSDPINAFQVKASNTTSDLFTVQRGGNVGIGTSAPAQKLHVAGNAYVTGFLGVGSSNPVKTLDVRGDAYISGDVGIGTTNPDASLKVNTGKYYRVGHFRTDRDGVGDNRTNTPPFLFENARGDQAWGVVAEFRTNELIDGNDRPSIMFSSGITDTQWTLGMGNALSDIFTINQDHGFYDSGWGTTRLAIDTAGNVGIGTTAPADTLDVNGDVRVRGGDIKDSGGTARITFSGTNVIIRVG